MKGDYAFVVLISVLYLFTLHCNNLISCLIFVFVNAIFSSSFGLILIIGDRNLVILEMLMTHGMA